MAIAVYPGSFDPVTMGHVDVIRRAASIFDTVRVCVMRNPDKTYTFSEAERMAFLKESTRELDNVIVDAHDGLLMDYAVAKGAKVVIKGLRTIADFEYEMQMDYFNKWLAPGVETLYLMADNKYSVLSASAIRQLMAFDGELAGLVPPAVLEAVADRHKREEQNQ